MHTARDTGRTRADNPAIPSRRGLLAASASALVAGAAIAAAAHGAPVASPGAPGDDAALIADCQAFIAWEHHVRALYRGQTRIEDDDERDIALDALQEHQRPLMDRICTAPATTLEGARAKGTALATWASDLLNPPTTCWDERLLASLLADLSGRGAA